jgi:BlaI family transcriptional regulator, penicillinase repressor
LADSLSCFDGKKKKIGQLKEFCLQASTNLFTSVIMSRKNAKKERSTQAEAVAITEAEWQVMELLWERAPRASQEIAALMEEQRGWKRATVLTLLSRLTAKGAVTTEQQGNRFLYSAAVERAACVSEQTKSFLNRLFGGSLHPLVAHCAEHQTLTKKDIAQLKALLDEIKPKSK